MAEFYVKIQFRKAEGTGTFPAAPYEPLTIQFKSKEAADAVISQITQYPDNLIGFETAKGYAAIHTGSILYATSYEKS